MYIGRLLQAFILFWSETVFNLHKKFKYQFVMLTHGKNHINNDNSKVKKLSRYPIQAPGARG
jgi:hypothetical protein